MGEALLEVPPWTPLGEFIAFLCLRPIADGKGLAVPTSRTPSHSLPYGLWGLGSSVLKTLDIRSLSHTPV